MCSLKSDGNGGQYIRFGPKEWIGLVGVAITAAALTAALNGAWVDLKIKAAIATHTINQSHHTQGGTK